VEIVSVSIRFARGAWHPVLWVRRAVLLLLSISAGQLVTFPYSTPHTPQPLSRGNRFLSTVAGGLTSSATRSALAPASVEQGRGEDGDSPPEPPAQALSWASAGDESAIPASIALAGSSHGGGWQAIGMDKENRQDPDVEGDGESRCEACACYRFRDESTLPVPFLPSPILELYCLQYLRRQRCR
jgi:hypothetical protein